MFGKSATQTLKVTHVGGLHARPCLAIAQAARRFQARITLGNGRETVDAREVLQLLTLGAACGGDVTITAKGADAEAAVAALVQLFADNFGMEANSV